MLEDMIRLYISKDVMLWVFFVENCVLLVSVLSQHREEIRGWLRSALLLRARK